jgi:hypothetical protein
METLAAGPMRVRPLRPSARKRFVVDGGPAWYLKAWRNWKWWLIASVIVVTALALSFKLTPSVSPNQPTQGVSAATTTRPPPRIQNFLKEFTSVYNNDLVYVNAEGTPLFPWHNVRFERNDNARPEGRVVTLGGGVKPKPLTWVDYPTSEDLMFRFPLTEREMVAHLTSGTLVAKTDDFKYVFRRDQQGRVQVLESVTYGKPVKETWYALARLSNPM